MSVKVIECELQLLDWRESAKGGCVVVFQVAYPSELEAFKLLELGKARGKVGQRFAAVLALIGDDEQPVQTAPCTPAARE